MKNRAWQRWNWLRLARMAMLALVVLTMREHHRWLEARTRQVGIALADVRVFLPGAAALQNDVNREGAVLILDEKRQPLGQAFTTEPESRAIFGYSGHSHSLIVLDAQGKILGVSLLRSDDTDEHVEKVHADAAFWQRLREQDQSQWQGVSGATLTSAAIAEGVQRKMGQKPASLRFPKAVTLEEVKEWMPTATALREQPDTQLYEVLEATGTVLATVTRTSPAADAVPGYQGPTDVLVKLDTPGERLAGLRLRDSYDTPEYVATVREDKYFLNSFNDLSVGDMAKLDFEKHGVEGVSGSTQTSYAVAEGLKQRMTSLQADKAKAATQPARPAGWFANWRPWDWSLLAFLGGSLLMAFTHLRSYPWLRRIWQVSLIVGAGVWLGGLLSQELLLGWAARGAAWRQAPALVLLAAAALLVPWGSGRQVYCHQFCPHGAAQQALGRWKRWHVRLSPRLVKALELIPGALLLLLAVSVIGGWRCPLSAFEPFHAYTLGFGALASMILLIVSLVASLFYPLAYCRFGCPTGALLRYVRNRGQSDRWGLGDTAALALLAGSAAWMLARGMIPL